VVPPATGWRGLPPHLESLRYRDFRLLLGGLFMALSGWWMIIVAQGWLVLELTDRASAVALVGAMLSVPFLLLGPLAGVAADRMSRKRLLVGTRSTVAVLMLVEGVLIVGGWIALWQLVVLAFLAGCAFAMDIPARQSLIPDTVPRAVVPNAVALQVSMFSATTIAGPLLGAAVLLAVGAGGCFLVNALGNAVLAAAIGAMRIPRRKRGGRWNVAGDFASGLRYARDERTVLLLLLVALVVTLTGRNWQQLAPVLVRDVYGQGEGALGALYTAVGAGAAVGAVGLVLLSGLRRRARLFALALGLAFAAQLGVAVSPALGVGAACALLTGLGLQVTETTTQTVVLVETPAAMRGRVLSLVSLLWGLQPLGVVVAGVVADAAGVRVAIASSALVGAAALAALGLATPARWRSF
jgi:MFS family permease